MKLLTNDDERRKTDIQGITKAHPEHSSGELKKTEAKIKKTSEADIEKWLQHQKAKSTDSKKDS